MGDAPSTLRLILPEANLKAPNVDEYIADINASMDRYLTEGVFQVLPESLVYIERQQSDGRRSATASSAWWTWTPTTSLPAPAP